MMKNGEKITLTNKSIADNKLNKEKNTVGQVTITALFFLLCTAVLFGFYMLGKQTLYAGIVFAIVTVMLFLGVLFGIQIRADMRSDITDGNFFIRTDIVRKITVDENGYLVSLIFDHYEKEINRKDLEFQDSEIDDEFYFLYMGDNSEPFAFYPCRHYELANDFVVKQAQW